MRCFRVRIASVGRHVSEAALGDELTELPSLATIDLLEVSEYRLIMMDAGTERTVGRTGIMSVGLGVSDVLRPRP